MRKLLLMAFMPCVMMFMALSSCSSDDDFDPCADFNYSAEALYGTWEITKLGVLPWVRETTTATFNPDGSYSGKGYFGNGSGTFKATGNRIYCYINGELYCTYEVQSLSSRTAVLRMHAGSDSDYITITCEKQ